jgi:hypothetical protein
MARVVCVYDRNHWVYLNVDQIVRMYRQEKGLWALDTAEGGPTAHHYLSDEHALMVLAAMGWTEQSDA